MKKIKALSSFNYVKDKKITTASAGDVVEVIDAIAKTLIASKLAEWHIEQIPQATAKRAKNEAL